MIAVQTIPACERIKINKMERVKLISINLIDLFKYLCVFVASERKKNTGRVHTAGARRPRSGPRAPGFRNYPNTALANQNFKTTISSFLL